MTEGRRRGDGQTMKEERKENEGKGEGSDRWDDLKRKAQSIAGWLEAGEERKQTREWEGEDSQMRQRREKADWQVSRVKTTPELSFPLTSRRLGNDWATHLQIFTSSVLNSHPRNLIGWSDFSILWTSWTSSKIHNQKLEKKKRKISLEWCYIFQIKKFDMTSRL